jgi:hypothetical protein
VTLQAAIEAELPGLRAEAEARMTSRVTIRRATGRTTQDETTGSEAAVFEMTHADLPFRLAGTYRGDSPSRTVDVGGVEVTLAVRVGSVPAETQDIADGDLIEVTSGECAGTVWRIVEADFQDQATARRLPIVATQRPTEWP